VSQPSKARFITLAELCEVLGISKSRFYALQKKGVFPEPQRAGNRPVFDQQQVEQCVGVVRSRVGLNGEPVLIRCRTVADSSKNRPATVKVKHEEMIASLQSLGVTANAVQVEAALKSLPDEGKGMDDAARLRAIFLELRKNAG
jgi:predicted DNA-binding transcriptional regulator AlpA